MADPNTQIDWWIAQAWQEAQGGAENDALVAWLHENELTAISSYTILQAALGCTPDEAKNIVFGHPAWAGEAPDLDTANLDYTSDTLEPEPEPDPAFQLDDWAEQVEEGPVYGEEGYQANPAAGADASPMQEPEQAFAGADDPGETSGFDAEPAGLLAPDTQPSPMNDGEPAPVDAMVPPGDPGLAPAQPFELAPQSAPMAEIESAAMEAAPVAAEPAPAFEEPAPPPAVTPDVPVAPLETMQPAVAPAPLEPALDEEAEFQPAPAMDTPAVPPPILRTPPSTPAERAAVFAGAFGKKPATAQPPAPAPDTSSAPETPPSSQPNSAPPASDAGPAVEAEPAPAQCEPEQPQPATATAQVPPPLVHEPLPEIEMPRPVAPAEPLFDTVPRDPQPDPPLFPPVATPEPAFNVGATDDQEEVAPLGVAGPEDMPAPEDAHADIHGESEPAIASNGLDAAADGAPEQLPEPVIAGDANDLPPGMRAAMEQVEAEPRAAIAPLENERDGGLSPVDRERQPLSMGEAENEEPDPDYILSPNGLEEDGALEYEAAADEAGAPRPGNRTLIAPSGEAEDAGYPGGDPPTGDTPGELAEAARRLGISFRESDISTTGVDPETAQAAKDLGISFREGGGAAEPGMGMDETALEAERLGISFRDGGLMSDKPAKPLIVKYLPLLLGVIAIFFLLLLGATFASDIISWIRS